MIHKLEADGIQLAFDGRKILSGIYIKCETGKITGLLGRNGEGKSCLLQVIYGSLSCERSIRFDNVSQPKAFAKPGLISFLPQFNFIPRGLSLKRIFSDFGLDYSVFEKKFPEFVSRYRSSVNQLSGGEQRLVELYVIVKSRSQFAMLDEPFTHLNPLQIEKAKELLEEEKSNKGFIVTDHMYRHIMDISTNLYVLANGRTHLTKQSEEVEMLGYARL